MNERSTSYIPPHDDGSTAPLHKHCRKHMISRPIPKSRFAKASQWAMSRQKRASGSVPVPLPLLLGWLAWLAWASGALGCPGG